MSTTASILAEIRVPRETVNDDTVTIQEWHARQGEQIKAKQLLVSIETSKAVLEVEAEADGFLHILHAKGAEVPIGELIGHISDSPSQREGAGGGLAPAPSTNGHSEHTPAPRSSNRLRDRAAAVTPGESAPGPSTGGTEHSLPSDAPTTQTISKKAQRLIDEHALTPARDFAGLGLVREVDVIRFLERRAALRMTAQPQPPSPATIAVSEPVPAPEPQRISATVNTAYERAPKGLFGDAASSAKDRGNRSVVWLAWNYLWRNWFLGHMVRIAPRGVILTLHKWRGVKMGRDVFIDPTAIVETAFPENITIGNDVRITAGCVIMSHIKAPHYLRETGLVPVVLKPVVLEDHCFIGVNSVIMPGVTVGKASVVTSGSVVVTNVPAYTMVQGNPAKVIKHFPRPDEKAVMP